MRILTKCAVSFFGAALFLTIHSPVSASMEAPYVSGKYIGVGEVSLWWSEIPDATYQVLYGPKDNPQAHGIVLGSGTRYNVRSLFKNTTYVFAVKAVHNGDVSSMSNALVIRTGEGARTPLPKDQSINSDGSAQRDQVVTPAVTYRNRFDTMRTNAPFNDPGISSGKPGIGHLNLRTSMGLTSGTVILHWNAPDEHSVGYYNVVYTDDPAMEKWGVLEVPNHLRSYVVSGLKSGVRYYFWMSSETTGRTPWVSDIAR